MASKNRLTNGFCEYICKTCHQCLVTENGKNPRMLRKAHARSRNDPGTKFLQAIREKPEFVCTCCHRWLFRKTVMVYDEPKYDMSDPIVSETLARKYRHPMEVIIIKGKYSVHEHATDYGHSSDSGSECDNTNDSPNLQHQFTLKHYEYICVTCHNCLKRKKPKMPAQACANGLQLTPIPPELQNLSDLERKLIALRIPFMVIFCLMRYGSQYKARGGCTNVPTTLKQVVNMLPRMSSEVQYHPMKLKKKMIFKSNYMYNFIRKDVVAAAIKWLKENNPLYSSIELNEDWANSWINSDLSSFVEGMDNDECEQNINDDSNETNGKHLSSDEVLEQKELEEDCVAADRALLTTGKPAANMLQYENLEQEIYTCAPGENNTPQYILTDDEFEVLAYPDMFPLGRGGYATSGDRKSKLTLRKYFQQRLFNVDGRFANNIEYLFCAQYATDIKQIKSDSNMS